MILIEEEVGNTDHYWLRLMLPHGIDFTRNIKSVDLLLIPDRVSEMLPGPLSLSSASYLGHPRLECPDFLLHITCIMIERSDSSLGTQLGVSMSRSNAIRNRIAAASNELLVLSMIYNRDQARRYCSLI